MPFLFQGRKNETRAGMGKLFTRRARFGKTVEAAGHKLIGKQGEDLLLEITVHECDNQNKRFHLVFFFNFVPLRLIFSKITAIRDL